MTPRRLYRTFGALLLAGWAWAEWTGWELPSNASRTVVPASARNAGGYRTWHFWTGGK